MIRHGLTEANLEGRYIGTTDLPLCEQGRASLEQLYKSCDYPEVDRVYTSPLKRAVQTAEILYPDSLIEPVDKLRELDFGDFEGKPRTSSNMIRPFRAWISSHWRLPPSRRDCFRR
jgi:alpha-ribazole phosphatase